MKHSWNEEEQGRGIMADRFDLDAIEADDALLDLLAAGGESARAAGEHDLAVALLAELRLAVEVEDELPVETIDDPESFLARCAALNPITDPFARKVATRGLAFGVAAVAALSVSGVAAAVNGDPLSPYEKVIEKMVDAVRPQTSFPKEDLDGLPVMDKTKIVKVGKDYKKQQVQAERDQTAGKGGTLAGVDPNSIEIKTTPSVVVPEKPSAVLDKPSIPFPTDVKTTDPDNVDVEKPSDTKTDVPTDTTGGDTTPTPTPPPSTPTDTPTSTPTDPPSTPTDTTSTPANVDAGTGDDTTSGDPTSTPAGDTGQTDGSGADGTGASDTSGSDTTTPGSEQKPGGEVTQTPGDQTDPASIVGDILNSVLPTLSGEPITIESAKLFFGRSQAGKPPTAKKAVAGKKATGKHSSGKVTTGSVRKAYPKGKHSTGAYPEGKHAAIERTHGSTADADVLAILNVVNAPINK
jgi:hypothetical protein